MNTAILDKIVLGLAPLMLFLIFLALDATFEWGLMDKMVERIDGAIRAWKEAAPEREWDRQRRAQLREERRWKASCDENRKV